MVKEIKTKLNFIDEYIEAINPATGSKYDSNANVTNKNLSTLTCEIPKKDFLLLNRAITSNYIENVWQELAINIIVI